MDREQCTVSWQDDLRDKRTNRVALGAALGSVRTIARSTLTRGSLALAFFFASTCDPAFAVEEFSPSALQAEQEAEQEAEPTKEETLRSLNENLGKYRVWIASVEGKDNDPSFGKQLPKVMDLYNGFNKFDRLEEALDVALEYVRVCPPQLLQSHHALYRAARIQLERNELASVETLLDELASRQTEWLKTHERNKISSRERCYRYIARARLHRLRGLLDLAQTSLDEAQKEFDLAFPDFPDEVMQGDFKNAWNVWSELRRIKLDIEFGAGNLRQVIRRGKADLALLPGDSVEQEDARLARLWVPITGAMHMDGIRSPDRFDEALEVQLARRAIEIKNDPPELEATFRAADLLLHAGRRDEARSMIEDAVEFANSTIETAEALALKGRLALESGETISPALDKEFDEAYRSVLSQWERDAPIDSGSSFLQFERRRMLVQYAMRFALAQQGADGSIAIERYLASERLGSLGRRLRDGAGGEPIRTLEDIRERLIAHGEAYYVPVISWYGSTLIAISATEVCIVPAPPQWKIRDDLNELRRLIDGEGYPTDNVEDRADDIRAYGVQLGATLLPEEILEVLDAADFTTIIEGAAGSAIPLQMAVVNGAPFLEQHSLCWVPSFDVEATLHEKGSKSSEYPLTILANTAASGLHESGATERLDSVEIEEDLLQSIAGPFSANGRILERDEASEPVLQSGVLAASSVGEIIAHGAYDLTSVLSAMIVVEPGAPTGDDGTSSDGLWRYGEIATAGVSNIMVLATCRAGQGPTRAGDVNASDLGGAFLLAGAQAVVMAKGDLPLDSTLEFLREFNAKLAVGASVAEAAQAARLSVKGKEGFDDPYHYAQLQVIGRGDLRPFPDGLAEKGDPDFMLLYAIVIAILLLVVIAVFSRRLGNRAID